MSASTKCAMNVIVVSILAEYIELAVHLASNSYWGLICFVSSKSVKQNEGGAVPLAWIIQPSSTNGCASM